MKLPAPLERDILKLCLDWLNCQPNTRVWRQNTGSFALGATKKRFFRAGSPGMSDISGIGPQGRRIEIEVKRPGQTPSDVQLEWLALIHNRGGIAFWADSLEMLQDNWGI